MFPFSSFSRISRVKGTEIVRQTVVRMAESKVVPRDDRPLLFLRGRGRGRFLFHRKKPAGRLESLPEDLALVLKNRKNKNGTFCDWFYDWQSNKMKGNSEKVKKSDKKKTKKIRKRDEFAIEKEEVELE